MNSLYQKVAHKLRHNRRPTNCKKAMAEPSTAQGATEALANFIHEVRFADLPESARHAARRAFVNIVGCCLSGARHEIVDITARALLPFGGKETSSLIGRVERTDALTAALLNCLSSAAYSFDDTHAETILHPSGAVTAALLSLAEQQPMSGPEFMVALVAGVDVASRLSKAVCAPPAKGDIGWSQTGIAAGIGAAAAASRALRLEPHATVAALGIAAIQASGLRVAHGTMAATLIFGHAAQCGLRAALLAREGITAPTAPIEGKHGFASLFANHAHLAYLTDALGKQFEVEALTFKPYPSGIVIHPAVDAALEWYRTARGDSTAIGKIRLHAHPSALTLGSRRHPANPLEAKVSLCHWIAAALRYGRASLAEVQESVIAEPEVKRLRDTIELVDDPAQTPESTLLTVTEAGVEPRTIVIAHCKGSIANPMTDEDLAEKFRGQAQLRLSAQRTSELLESCWQVDQLADLAHLLRLALPA